MYPSKPVFTIVCCAVLLVVGLSGRSWATDEGMSPAECLERLHSCLDNCPLKLEELLECSANCHQSFRECVGTPPLCLPKCGGCEPVDVEGDMTCDVHVEITQGPYGKKIVFDTIGIYPCSAKEGTTSEPHGDATVTTTISSCGPCDSKIQWVRNCMNCDGTRAEPKVCFEGPFDPSRFK